MAKKAEGGRRTTGKRPSPVAAAKRGGPPKGFWMALVAVAVLGVGALSWVATRPKATATKVDPTLPALKAEGYLLGNPNAPVEIIEFADFECPGCGQFATLTEPDIRARMVNTGQVRMRFMDFPLDIHKNTWDASLAASCANEQGKFWEMHDLIFQNQDRANVQANLKEGERRQVSQTPTFIIGDQKIPGAIPFDTFRKLVDVELTKYPAVVPADTTKVPPTDAKRAAPLTPSPKGQ